MVPIYATVDRSKLTLDRWFDRSTRNWICTLKDKDGNQVGDSIVLGDKLSAMRLTKDDFNIDPTDDDDDRYGFRRMEEKRKARR